MSNKTSIEGLSALLHTLMLIPQHRWVTVRELQQLLALVNIHRTSRSIKRYLDEIIIEVFNVECNSTSMPHVYRKTSEQLLKLSKQEMLHWQLTTKYLQPIIPEALNYNLGDSLNINNPLIYNGLSHSKEQQWLHKVHVKLPTIQEWSDEQRQILDALHTALLDSRMLKISSQSLQQNQIFIEPLGLSMQSDVILLLFRLPDQHSIHTIALPLIDKAFVSTFSFTYPSDFNIELFIRNYEELVHPKLRKVNL
ncbi:transcriptional regulator [Photobacterium phosphoreum]|uniref:transcriptional regulator n=1 Tax=Photobacterium phosphoreum TaxID=659 RepID=UPI0024324EB5|nr:transcriptional regulator [Photobacterium phosphoreum]